MSTRRFISASAEAVGVCPSYGTPSTSVSHLHDGALQWDTVADDIPVRPPVVKRGIDLGVEGGLGHRK